MAQKAIDDSQGSLTNLSNKCPVCQRHVSENLGRHMRGHGEEAFQQYMEAQRAATPSDYRKCSQCQKIFHKKNITSHVTKVHTGRRESGLGARSSSAVSPALSLTRSPERAGARSNELRPEVFRQEAMGPPPSKVKPVELKGDKTELKSSGDSVGTKKYSSGQVQEAVKRMIDHRETDTYTRESVREICRRELPGLSEFECDLAVDVTIATAREVAAVSQYAAAHRTMTASEQYKAANEQIATLVRGPKVQSMRPTTNTLLRPTPVFSSTQRTGSLFKPISSGNRQDTPYAQMGRGRKTTGQDSTSGSSNEATETPNTPLTQFIRSLRTPLSQAAMASPKPHDSTTGSEEVLNVSDSDSDVIPPSQRARTGPRVKYTQRKSKRPLTEDDEVRMIVDREVREGPREQRSQHRNVNSEETEDGQELSARF